MLALAAVSDELKKYPMLMDRLTAYAGPQCVPHLNKDAGEYRLHANDVRDENEQRRNSCRDVQQSPCPAVVVRNML